MANCILSFSLLDKEAQMTHANLGGTSDIPLKLTETDLSSLKASIRYPSGKMEPCIIKKLDNGQTGELLWSL